MFKSFARESVAHVAKNTKSAGRASCYASIPTLFFTKKYLAY